VSDTAASRATSSSSPSRKASSWFTI
jgi:hypothetical protein